jgi:cobalt-zinc-cadmium efflux system protein
MAHDHSHHHHGDSSNIGTAFFLNFGFTIIEIIGGFWTGSIAILSDALHDLGDTLSIGLAWYLQKVSKKKRSPNFTFGYKRFNTLGAIITGLVLVAGSVFILTEAIPALWNPGEPNAKGMIGLAILGVLVNGAAVFRLKKGGDSLNERVITMHLLEDVLGWVAVLIGSIVMYFYDVPWLDPAMSIGITIYILYGVTKNLWDAGKIILQATPDGMAYDKVQLALEQIDGVKDAHHLHLWTLDGQYHLGSAHLVVAASADDGKVESIKSAARRVAHDEFGLEHLTIEVEYNERASTCVEEPAV